MTEQLAQTMEAGAEMSPPTIEVDASQWGRGKRRVPKNDGIIEAKFDFDQERYAGGPDFVPIRERIFNPQGRTDYGWSDEKRREHLKAAHTRGWKEFPYAQFDRGHDGVMIICGGGPSLKDTLPELRRLARQPKHFVFSANKTHDFLFNLPKLGLGQAVKSWGACLLDPCDWVKDYITPRPGVNYFIGDQCAPTTFDVFEKPEFSKWVWRATNPLKDQDIIPQHLRFIEGGSTVGLRMMTLAYHCGFRKIHLFGFDSSTETSKEDPEGKLHAYAKDESVMMTLKRKTEFGEETKQVKERVQIKVLDEKGFQRTFVSNTHMARQAQEFLEIRDLWIGNVKKGQMHWIDFVVHGEGLLPTAAARLGIHADPKRNVPPNLRLVPVEGTKTFTTEQLEESINAG